MAKANELTTEQQEVLDTLSKPVQTKTRDDAHIGIFSLKNASPGTTTHLNLDASIKDWRDDLTRETRVLTGTTNEELNKEFEEKYDHNVAYAKEGLLNLPQYEITQELAQKINESENAKFNQTSQYITGNTIVEIEIMGHERTHYQHFSQHSGANDTPYMASQMSDMTEQIANFNEYMTVAHIWKNAKQSGAETITVNNQTIATDDILNYMPNLKETVLSKDGLNGKFDENDPACREKIAKVASDYWNAERSEGYAKQARKDAEATVGISQEATTEYSLAGAVVNAQEWEERKKMMVQDLKTGDGYTYSAPECLKYFVPSEERTQEIIKDIPNVSNEDLLKIGAYMDKQGLKTDAEREQFIAEQMIYITKRAPEADKEFANLLLSASPADKQEIVYADGISVKYEKDVATISRGDITLTTPATALADNSQLHQQIKDQKGKYPPDAPNAEIEQQRTLADKQFSNACTISDYHKANTAAKSAESPSQEQPAKQTQQTQTISAIIANRAQNSM